MTDTVVNEVSRTLKARGPAYADLEHCLDLQDNAPQPTALGRLLGITPLVPAARDCYRGALGAIEIAHVLEKLGTPWWILHAVPIGTVGAEIDHLIIGEAGVFALKTTHLPRADEGVIQLARDRAAQASRMLGAALGEEVAVTPVIVPVGPQSLIAGWRGLDIDVQTPGRFGRWATKLPRVLNESSVARISQAAGQPSTWGASGIVVNEWQDIVARFDTLHRHVESATHRQQLIVAVTALTLVLGLIAMTTRVAMMLHLG